MADMANKVIIKKYNKLNSLLRYYRWEFLRRNEGYKRDCEKWAEGRKVDWKNNVILGYRFKNTSFFRKYVDRWSALDIREWVRLGRRLGKLICRRQYETGEKPVYGCFHGWYKFYKKWLINVPLNPNYSPKQVPFFVSFKEKLAAVEKNLSEMIAPGCEIIKISPLKGTFDFNFNYPKGYLLDIFDIIMKAKRGQQIKEVQKGIFEEKGLPMIMKVNPCKKNYYIGTFEIDFTYSSKSLWDQFKEFVSRYGPEESKRYRNLKRQFDLYLKIYDLREKGLSYLQIATELKLKSELWDSGDVGCFQPEQRAYRLFKSAKRYIEKGFIF